MSDHSDSVVEDDDERYVPSRILNEVKENGRTKWLVEWEDWPLGAATIEPIENFDNNPGLLQQWRREKRRRRLGITPHFNMKEWKDAQIEWDALPEAKRNAIVAQATEERLAAEALGDYGEASPSVASGSSDEADEGPIDHSDEEADKQQRKPPKFRSRPLPEYSDDEDSDDDMIVAPNGARLPLGRPTQSRNANVGVTGYQGNANRAPLPPRMSEEELRQKKASRKANPSLKAKRDGERKKSQKIQDKLLAQASGQQANTSSDTTTFRNMATQNAVHKAGKALADRKPAVMPTLFIPSRDGPTLAAGTKSATPLSASRPTAAPAPGPAQARAASEDRGRRSESLSDDPAWNVDDDDDTPEGPPKSISTAMWPRMIIKKPNEKENLQKRHADLQKEISNAKSNLESSAAVSGSPYNEAVVFPARRTSSAGTGASGTLLPGVSSLGLVQPSSTISAIASGTAASGLPQSRARPQHDPMFVQPTRERVANQNRPSRPILKTSATSPAVDGRPRQSVSWQESRNQAPILTATATDESRKHPLVPVGEDSKAVYQAVNSELLGCQYESLLPHLANKKDEPAYYYLLFPAVAAPLADAITKWLRTSYNWAKVFHCQQPGSWTRFVELTSPKKDKINGGCLIVHSSMKHLIPKQPQLTVFLLNGSNMVWCADEDAAGGRILTQVFQAGGAILITPKMYQIQPQNVTHLLDWFLKHKLPATRGKIWKLVLTRNMSQFLHDSWQQSANLRKELVAQHKQAGKTDQDIETILASRALSRKDVECMYENYHLVRKIKQYGVPTNAVLGTKEAEPVYIELSSAIDHNDDVGLVDGFAHYALMHWHKTRKWLVIGTGRPNSVKEAQKKEPAGVVNGSTKLAEHQSIGDKAQPGAMSASTNGNAMPITTDDDIDRSIFMIQTGSERDLAEEYLKKSLGDITLAMKLYEIDLRDGKHKHGASNTGSTGPGMDGDTAMEDISQESGEIREISMSNGTDPKPIETPLSPAQTISSPSMLQAEIAANESMMEDAVSMVPDTAPPPPPELAPPPPPAKIKFNLPSPTLTKKSPSGATTPAPAAGSTAQNALDLDKDVSMTGQGESKPQLETRPTVEWWQEKKVANQDWKHIWVMGYDKALQFFSIKPLDQRAHHQAK